VPKVHAAVAAGLQTLHCCCCCAALPPPLLLLLLAAVHTLPESRLAPGNALNVLGPYALSVAETFLHTPGTPPITFSAKLLSTFTLLSGVQV
jgi:hypothetical protein